MRRGGEHLAVCGGRLRTAARAFSFASMQPARAFSLPNPCVMRQCSLCGCGCVGVWLSLCVGVHVWQQCVQSHPSCAPHRTRHARWLQGRAWL